MEMGPDVASLLRWIRISLPLALLLLVGGVAAGAANERSAGDILLGVAGASGCAGFVLLRVLRRRIRPYTRQAQARQQIDLDHAFRDGPR